MMRVRFEHKPVREEDSKTAGRREQQVINLFRDQHRHSFGHLVAGNPNSDAGSCQGPDVGRGR